MKIPPPGVRAFSLLEILSAAAIIVLLIALLVSSVHKLRNKALSASCLSNLRQIGVAFSSYSAENSGRMTPYAQRKPGTEDKTGKYWLDLLGPYLPPPKDSSYSYSKAFQCPADKRRREVVNPQYTDYGLAGANGIFFGTSSPVTGKNRYSAHWLDRAPIPANIPFLSRVMIVSDIKKYFMWGSADMNDPEIQDWRHDNGINCLFGDGHVESRKRETIPENPQDDFWNGGNPEPVPL